MMYNWQLPLTLLCWALVVTWIVWVILRARNTFVYAVQPQWTDRRRSRLIRRAHEGKRKCIKCRNTAKWMATYNPAKVYCDTDRPAGVAAFNYTMLNWARQTPGPYNE